MSNVNFDFDVQYEAQLAMLDYKNAITEKMNAINAKMEDLSNDWDSQDYRNFKGKLIELTNESSAYKKSEKMASSYYSYLVRCYNEYDYLSSTLQQLASQLPKA